MTLQLAVTPREGNAVAIREQGAIPGVVYGPEVESQSITIPYTEFEKLYNEAGESTLIDVSIGEKESLSVLIQEIQYHPVTCRIEHVDFRQIIMGQEIDATIELNFIGVAPAEKEQGGVLLTQGNHINVRCLPKDLVSSIDVDLSVLKTFEDVIVTGDITLPEGMVLTDNEDISLVRVQAPRSVEEQEKMQEGDTRTMEDIEVDEKEKEEDGEKEGEAKADGEGEKKSE